MIKQKWKEILEELREDREQNPVELFMLLLVLLIATALIVTIVLLLVYYAPVVTISIAIGLTLLWKLYKRL